MPWRQLQRFALSLVNMPSRSCRDPFDIIARVGDERTEADVMRR